MHGPPDGGPRAWLVAAAAFLSNGLIFGVINTFGVIYIYLQEELKKQEELMNQESHLASSKAALVGSLAIGTTFIFSVAAGILVDRVGIRVTALVGGFLATAGMLISSFLTNQVEGLYVSYGLLLGLGASLAYTPSLVILGHYFHKYMGLVNGVVCAGSSVFTVFMPFLLTALLDSVGLSRTFMCLSGLMAVLMLNAVIFKPLQEPGTKAPGKGNLVNLDIWKEKRYVIWALILPFTLLGYFVPYVHAVKYVSVTFPDSNGSFVVLGIGISSGIGRLVFGKIADFPKVDRIFLQQVSFVLIGVLTMLLTMAPDFPTLMVIVVGMGLFDGCFITLLGPIAYDLVGKAGAGQAIGCLLGLCSIPLTVGPPLAGLLYDHLGSYRVPFLLSGVPPIVGGVLLSLVRCVPPGESKHKATDPSSPAKETSPEMEALFKNKPSTIVIHPARQQRA